MKSINFAVVLGAILCGSITGFLVVRQNNEARVEASASSEKMVTRSGDYVDAAEEMVAVIVAKTELPVGTILADDKLENLLTQAKLPKASLPPNTINDLSQLIGRKLNRTLTKGSVFTKGDVRKLADLKLPEGMLKYAILADYEPDSTGPGDRVDVVTIKSLPDGKLESVLLLSRLLVLEANNSGGRQVFHSLALRVTDEQAKSLLAAEKRDGVKIKLILSDPQNKE